MAGATLTERRTIALISLGCSKNMVDSEMILGSLLENGFVLVSETADADVVVVNTCGFIGEAREESIDTIVRVLDQKSDSQKVIVSGCLSQRYGQELLEELPQIDLLLGINAPRDISGAVTSLFESSPEEVACHQITSAEKDYGPSQSRFLLTPKHHAYLRIADGCDQGCRFCAIPRIRGRQRSRSIDELVKEAQDLSSGGCRELNLVAHDLNSFGVDQSGDSQLSPLLKALNEVEGIEWIRLFYLYPKGFLDEHIESVATLDKVLPYIDMPLQHISDNMLKAMNRRITARETKELIEKIKSKIPEAVFRTTMLVGYPGETDQDFAELRSFVEEMRFTHLGVFPYSPEEGTAAYHRKPQVPHEVALQRQDELMLLQQHIVFERQDARIGSRLEVVCDGREHSELICRSWLEGPDSDPVIRLRSSHRQPGEVFQVTVAARDGYDLIAEE